MSRLIVALVVVALLSLPGCRQKPFRVDGKISMGGDVRTSLTADNTASRLAKVTVAGKCQSPHRVAVLDVDGLLINKNVTGLGSMGENPVALFREKLDAVAADPTIAAIVLRINSPGGGVTAADMMSHDLMRLKQQRQIPVVACNMVVGAGGAYYLATHADAIVAPPTCVVGGIGVILNAYYMELTMEQFNIVSVPIKAGNLIDTLTPEREMEDEERQMLQAMANSFHQRFITQVKQSRPDVIDEGNVFEGGVYTGQQAHELGLIDQVGYLDDAIALAKQLGGISDSGAVVMLRRDNDRAYTTYDITPNDPVQAGLLSIKLPGLDRSSMPMFLYLWQSDPSLAAATDG